MGKAKFRACQWIASLVTALTILSLTAPATVNAQPKISFSETELVFSGLVGETLQRTFTITVTGEPLTGLQIIIPDLVDPQTQAVILSERIALNPPFLTELFGNQSITVSLNGIEKFGSFEGDLKFIYDGQPEGENLSLRLSAVVKAVPTVDADVNSKNPNLFVEPSLMDFPFGRAEVLPDSPKLGEVVLSLVQSGDSPATIANARVLAMQSSQGLTLPENTVQVESEFPLVLQGKDAGTLRVVARGRNLPAGEFSGTLLVNVDNQPGPVLIPLKVQVKDGPLLAFILLAAGPLVGLLFFYWNKDGKVLLEARQRIERLQGVLKTGRMLTVEDQQNGRQKLESIIDAIVGKTDPSLITPLLDELEGFIKAQQTSGEAFMGALNAQAARLAGMSQAKVLHEKISAALDDLRRQIDTGTAPSWTAVQRQLEGVTAELDEIEALLASVQALDSETQAIVKPRIENARNLAELQNALAQGRSVPGKGLAGLFKFEGAGERPEWQKFNLSLEWRRLAVAAVVYLFTLFVGWITLYASAPTFGANREDYITLFLWGVASNVVGSQTIDLKSIMTRQE